jgi:hypothetical protein
MNSLLSSFFGKGLIRNTQGKCQFPALDGSEAIHDLKSKQEDLQKIQDIYQEQINHLEADAHLENDVQKIQGSFSQRQTSIQPHIEEKRLKLSSIQKESKEIEIALSLEGIAQKTAELKDHLKVKQETISNNKFLVETIKEVEEIEKNIERQKQVVRSYETRINLPYCESGLHTYLRPLFGLGYFLSFFAQKKYQAATEKYKKSLKELEGMIEIDTAYKNKKLSLLPSDQPIDQIKQKLLDENVRLQRECIEHQRDISIYQEAFEKNESIVNIQTARKLYTLVKEDACILMGYGSINPSSIEVNAYIEVLATLATTEQKRHYILNYMLKSCFHDKTLTSLKENKEILKQAEQDALEGNLNTQAIKTALAWEKILQKLNYYAPKIGALDRFHLISMLHFADLVSPSETIKAEYSQKGLKCSKARNYKRPVIEVKKTFFRREPIIRAQFDLSIQQGRSETREITVNLKQKTYTIGYPFF